MYVVHPQKHDSIRQLQHIHGHDCGKTSQINLGIWLFHVVHVLLVAGWPQLHQRSLEDCVHLSKIRIQTYMISLIIPDSLTNSWVAKCMFFLADAFGMGLCCGLFSSWYALFFLIENEKMTNSHELTDFSPNAHNFAEHPLILTICSAQLTCFVTLKLWFLVAVELKKHFSRRWVFARRTSLRGAVFRVGGRWPAWMLWEKILRFCGKVGSKVRKESCRHL